MDHSVVLVVSEKRSMFGYATFILQPILDPKTKIFSCLLVVAVFFSTFHYTITGQHIFLWYIFECFEFKATVKIMLLIWVHCFILNTLGWNFTKGNKINSLVVFYDVNTNTSNNCPPFNEITIQWMWINIRYWLYERQTWWCSQDFGLPLNCHRCKSCHLVNALAAD